MYFPTVLWIKIKEYTFDYNSYYKKKYSNCITHFENLFEPAWCFPNINFFNILPNAIMNYYYNTVDGEEYSEPLSSIEIIKINELDFETDGHTIGNMRCNVYYGWCKKI
jgi:hypothetical protein